MGTDDWGIDDGWWDIEGVWHDADQTTIETIRHTMAAHGDGNGRMTGPPLWFVDAGSAEPLNSPATIRLEDGTDVSVGSHLPPDLPVGVHTLHPHDSDCATTLFVAPASLPPQPVRRWGVTAQLYAARSRRSWGIGDLTDLVRLGRWTAQRGGTVLGVNPLGEALGVVPRTASPYSPSSRSHLDPLWIDVDRIDCGEPTSFRPHNAERIDRDAVWRAKRAALVAAYTNAGAPPPNGDLRHAVFCSLVESHGRGWPRWPSELQRPDARAIAQYASQHTETVGFWQWVERLADEQFDEARAELASLGVTLFGDLTVGVDPDGFEAWCHQDVLARDMSVGAPPDAFNPAGQNWGLPPFEPWSLRAGGYESFRSVIRAAFRRYGGLRIDHVMGLFRLFWIPRDGDPHHGAYVRYRPEELLAVVRIEAARHGAFVVGEDLGTVEAGVRERIAASGIAGTKVGWFDDAPETWPAGSLGTLTTHDLPTVRGGLSSSDPAADPSLAAHLRDVLGPDASGLDDIEVLLIAHRRLAAAGSDLVLVTTDDLVAATDRPNQPALGTEYPSWCIPLPATIEELDGHPVAERVADAMAAARPVTAQPEPNETTATS